ncbi:patatin-like phospholipase domain-containing protein [Mycolicibacterium gadium]|uniref:PNPLA domain-containing protein n=1 Tax=Mycolicibacterium gadium TaxID=1794 RepID=A0ABT6GVY0_MYCGU|nr:hypothetical protein [Mycolicibacterium gadium]MDG5485494.1 hypothetical protein [Mycolicibacterium gadium]
MNSRAPIGLVYGGGGPLATAVGMGAAQALAAGGLVISDLPALGTSGGSVAAAAARADIPYDDVVQALRGVRLPERRPGYMRAMATELFGDRHDPLLWTSVVRLSTGRRTRLCGADHPVAAIVAASCAVPFLVAPERIGAHRYIDGGARSWVSADLAPTADHLIVIAPVVAPSFGRFGSVLSGHLSWELRRWRRRTGGRTTVIRVVDDLASRVKRWADLFNPALAADARAHARAVVTDALAPDGRLHDLLSTRTAAPPDEENTQCL